jgi:multiple sugar transport system substrate-binding protein
MINLRYRPLIFLLLLTLVGCTNLPFSLGSGQQVGTRTPDEAHTPTILPTIQPEETVIPTTPGRTAASTQQITGSLIRIWLPPEFDPEGNSPASGLLKARLDEFTTENPEVRLEVRIKDLNGPGGLLESLAAANVSAPLTLPDLVLLPRPLLESAALKGLLTPFDGLTNIMDDRNWFDYARQLSRLKASTYGLPFAGDAMVLAYHPSLIEATPYNFDSLLPLSEELLFPASDPQALYTLGIYQDGGGSLQDEQGRPYLDKTILTKVFEFEQQASLAGVMPYWLTQYSNDEQVWEAFSGDQFPMAISWASTYMKNKPGTGDDLSMSPIPTWDGSPFTLADGWSWALAGRDPERRLQSVKLAEFLLENEFMAAWSSAAGYLPPRADALQGWEDASLHQIIEQISYSAQLVPPADLVSSLGPALEQAVVEVLKAESDPQTAAQTVIDQVNQP